MEVRNGVPARGRAGPGFRFCATALQPLSGSLILLSGQDPPRNMDRCDRI